LVSAEEITVTSYFVYCHQKCSLLCMAGGCHAVHCTEYCRPARPL